MRSKADADPRYLSSRKIWLVWSGFPRYHTGPLQLIPMMLRGFYGVGLTKMEAQVSRVLFILGLIENRVALKSTG